MSFEVGQKVVCVDDAITNQMFPGTHPVKGSVYTICGVFLDVPWRGDTSYQVEELGPKEAPIRGLEILGGFPVTYHSDHFAPIAEKEHDIGVFKEILKNPKKKIPKDAHDNKRKKVKESTQSTNGDR